MNKTKIVFITSVYKMQYINLGIVFLPLTLIALDLRVVIANRTQLPQYYYQFSIIYLFIDCLIYLFLCNLGNVHLI